MKNNRVLRALTLGGVATLASDESDTAYKIFGGYQFNHIFGVEVGYFNLGKFGFNLRTLPAGTLAGTIKAQGANVDLVSTGKFDVGKLSAVAKGETEPVTKAGDFR